MRRNPYKGWADYAAGFTGRSGRNQNTYNPNAGPYAGWADYARGYKASHPQAFPAASQAPSAPPGVDPNWNFSNGPAPTPNPQPWDTQYENTVSGINRRTGDTLADIEYQRGQTNQTFGYQSDPNGNLTVDPSNPFSKAALLQRSFEQGQARSGNQMAAAGQLYSGAAQHAQNVGVLQNQQNVDANKRAYAAALQGLAQRRTAALTNQSMDTTTAQGDALSRALANRPDPATLPVNPAWDFSGGPAPLPPKAKPRPRYPRGNMNNRYGGVDVPRGRRGGGF